MNRPYGVDRNAAVKLRGVEDAAPYGFYISTEEILLAIRESPLRFYIGAAGNAGRPLWPPYFFLRGAGV